MTKTSHISDFTSGNITKQLVVFATPLLLSNLLQVVYIMVDMIVVGQVLGQVGLSAVSVGGDITHFMTFVGMGFAADGQVIISQLIGAGERHKIDALSAPCADSSWSAPCASASPASSFVSRR